MLSDTRLSAVCTVAYSGINQQNLFCQNLITSKSRLPRKNLSIPRFELVAKHMSADLAENLKTCLIKPCKKNKRKKNICMVITTVLHWLKNNTEYKTFVSNRVSKIKGKSLIEWKYVHTKEDTADLGSRGCEICKLDNKWRKGPKWL